MFQSPPTSYGWTFLGWTFLETCWSRILRVLRNDPENDQFRTPTVRHGRKRRRNRRKFHLHPAIFPMSRPQKIVVDQKIERQNNPRSEIDSMFYIPRFTWSVYDYFRTSSPRCQPTTWLVVHHPWKIWVRQLGWWHSQVTWENNSVMFQSPPTRWDIPI